MLSLCCHREASWLRLVRWAFGSLCLCLSAGTAVAGGLRARPGAQSGDGQCSGCADASHGQPIRVVDIPQMCACHEDQDVWFHHPVNLEPSKVLADAIPSWLPLSQGKLTCDTCHEVQQLCSDDGSDDPLGLRLPSQGSRSQPCYICHPATSYQRLNVHEQLDPAGRYIEETCLYCHTRIPGTNYGLQSVALVDDITGTCWRCHRESRHPGGVNHLRVPSDEMSARLDDIAVEFHVILPRDETGKITCITCHNPHQRGVIPVDLPEARGADEDNRLRVPQVLCQRCHDR